MHVYKQDVCARKHIQKLILVHVPHVYGIELVTNLYYPASYLHKSHVNTGGEIYVAIVRISWELAMASYLMPTASQLAGWLK